VIEAEQFCPPTHEVGQLSVTPKSASEEVTVLTLNGAPPRLVSTALSTRLAVPTNSVGNASVVGVTAATGMLFVRCRATAL